jgi:hypothetical protein
MDKGQAKQKLRDLIARETQCRSAAGKRDAAMVLRKPLSSSERRAVEDNLAAQDEALH